MVSQTTMCVGLLVLILIVLALVLLIISRLTEEDIANKSCKELGSNFDPVIFTVLGIHPSHFMCDIFVRNL